SGTTSLFNYLEEHPEVFVPKIKEPHFFSHPEVASTYYKTTLIGTMAAYESLYEKAASFKAVGDLSSSYLFNPRSAGRIWDYNPKAKIVMILRNPVERAVSHYLMDRNLGLIQKPLRDVMEKPEENRVFYEQYVELGHYEAQIKRYLDCFKRDRILILLSDELFEDTPNTLTKLFHFLGVDKSFMPDLNKRYNQFKEPRFPFINRLKNSRGVKRIFDSLPGGFKKIVTRAAFDTQVDKPLLEEERSLLLEMYKTELEGLEALIEKDLSSWKNAKPS
ncbi:MAG: sulfotransferase domain-containing protein, partial [Bacteroidota bacterium]